MSSEVDLLCPCGAPAPTPLPGPGRRPARCTACGSPLVQPGGIARGDVERGLGAALLVASMLAVGWMFAVRTTGEPLHRALPLVGLLVALATVAGARARGPAVQWSAGLAFVVAIVLGEVLIYRGALLARLVHLHEVEGAPDAAALAQQEMSDMDVARFLHVELSLWLFVGAAGGLLLCALVAHAPAAVEAFRARPEDPGVPEPSPAPLDEAPDEPEEEGLPCP